MISLGQKFASYEELHAAIEDFEYANNVKFMKLKTTKLNKIEIPYGNDKLVYKSIIFHCIKGGHFIKRGKGIRNRSTEKQDCPAHITLRISNDGQSLVVRSIEVEHNHEISERWVYFKDGISKNVRRRLNLKKMFMRNVPNHVDGYNNLYAALIQPKALEALQTPPVPRGRKRKCPQQEIEAAAESICLGEVPTLENVTQSPVQINLEGNEQVIADNVQDIVENEFCGMEIGQLANENELCANKSEQCSKEDELCNDEKDNEEISLVLENQKSIQNTLEIMNENIHILNSNMVTMANALNGLIDKIGNITHVVLKKMPQS